jgi:hypothetical protein
MHNEDHPATASEPQRPKAVRRVWILIALLAIGSLLFGILVMRDHDGSDVASRNSEPDIPRRNLDAGLAGGRLRRSGGVRISSYFRTL